MRSLKRSAILGFLFLMLGASQFSFAEEPSPSVSSSTVSPESAFDPLQIGRLDLFKTERGVERSDLLADALLLKAEGEIGTSGINPAISSGEAAERLSPESPGPHFFLARLYWTRNKGDVPNIFAQYATGLRAALSDFWFSFSMMGTLLFLALGAALLAFLTFFIFTVLSYAPLWIHQITEWFQGYLHPIGAGLLFLTVLFLPLIFGFPLLWFFIFIPFLFWGFYRRQEKGVTIAFLVQIGAALWLLPLVCLFFTAKRSVLLNEMVKNYQKEFYWKAPPLGSVESDWKSLALQASYETQQGNYKTARALYESALSQNQAPMLLNNLGNVSFYMKEYPNAIERYQQASNAAPQLVSAHYNASQTYREMLSFDQGSQKYQQAKGINRELAEEYTRKSAFYSGRPMIEERFTKTDLWNEVAKMVPFSEETSEKIWRGWVGTIPLTLSPMIAVLGLLSFLISSFVFERLTTAQFCAVCKKAICKKCQQNIFDYKVCVRCRNEFKSVKKKSDLALLEERKEKEPARLYPFLLFPGGGQFGARKTVSGFLFLTLFFFMLGYAGIGELLFSSAQWHLNGGRWIWVPAGLLIVYLISFLDLIRIRSR